MSDHVYDCDAGESCAVWNNRKIKARKPQKCCECGHVIVPGEEHWRLDCMFDGCWSHDRTCLCCEAARCAVAKIAAEHDGYRQACILHGELRNAVRDGIREGWLDPALVGPMPGWK